jgi:hypothetical protein
VLFLFATNKIDKTIVSMRMAYLITEKYKRHPVKMIVSKTHHNAVTLVAHQTISYETLARI